MSDEHVELARNCLFFSFSCVYVIYGVYSPAKPRCSRDDAPGRRVDAASTLQNKKAMRTNFMLDFFLHIIWTPLLCVRRCYATQKSCFLISFSHSFRFFVSFFYMHSIFDTPSYIMWPVIRIGKLFVFAFRILATEIHFFLVPFLTFFWLLFFFASWSFAVAVILLRSSSTQSHYHIHYLPVVKRIFRGGRRFQIGD